MEFLSLPREESLPMSLLRAVVCPPHNARPGIDQKSRSLRFIGFELLFLSLWINPLNVSILNLAFSKYDTIWTSLNRKYISSSKGFSSPWKWEKLTKQTNKSILKYRLCVVEAGSKKRCPKGCFCCCSCLLFYVVFFTGLWFYKSDLMFSCPPAGNLAKGHCTSSTFALFL